MEQREMKVKVAVVGVDILKAAKWERPGGRPLRQS
jgi:hypothetical protein